LAEPRLKIAVFIDFDNIEIGVKTTLGSHFDAGAVLEAIKERGEVVTKIAYGDWTRAGDYSRSLTQHAIHMVQRNLTPGGDKNGADINLALDALEMAFTHSHINTFVIVGGDSDFMALVEKLKQYDRKVLVVGGRAFTSHILQKNCHEFIAYENLIGRRAGPRGRVPQDTPLTGAVTLVRRALKVLADREVSPQLGVLKSTLLQLDPTFSEREYGASTFRDLVQRLGRAGYVTLKGTDRNIFVELREGSDGAGTSAPPREGEAAAELGPEAVIEAEAVPAEPAAEVEAREPREPRPREHAPREHAPREREPQDREGREREPREREPREREPREGRERERSREGHGPAGDPAQQAETFRFIREVFQRPNAVSRWPLYLRQVKQVLRTADESFDERRGGFSGLVEALRYCQREGLFRLDRDRQGVLRVYPGAQLQVGAPASPRADGLPLDSELEAEAAELEARQRALHFGSLAARHAPAPDAEAEPESEAGTTAAAAPEDEPGADVGDAEPVADAALEAGAEAAAPEEPGRQPRRRAAAKKAAAPRKNSGAAKSPRAAKPAAPKGRKSSRKSGGE
jgi:uncharacterized LabA/DUF88 family protein